MPPRDYDELLAPEHTFKVRGETFTWREVRPEILDKFTPNGKAKVATWKDIDEQILTFLVPEDHARWKKLRSREDNAVSIAQVGAILEDLWVAQTDRPTKASSE